jgi:hypothetical protein
MPRALFRELPGVWEEEGCILSCFSRLSFSSKTRAVCSVSMNASSHGGKKQLTENVVSELWELQTHLSEFVLRLRTQGMTSRRPEVRNRRPDRSVVLVRVCVDVSGVCDLALRSGVHAVDLRGGQCLQCGQAERFSESVDSCVLKELVARLVDFWCVRVLFKVSCARDLAGEVVACVEEFKEASNSV